MEVELEYYGKRYIGRKMWSRIRMIRGDREYGRRESCSYTNVTFAEHDIYDGGGGNLY